MLCIMVRYLQHESIASRVHQTRILMVTINFIMLSFLLMHLLNLRRVVTGQCCWMDHTVVQVNKPHHQTKV